MVDVKEDLLNLSKKVELCMENLYSLFASKIEQDKELWEKLAEEERIHANLIDKFSKEYKQLSSKMVADNSILIRLKNSMNDINTYIREHRSEKISRKEAFEKAIQFEEMTLEVHFHDFFLKIQPPGSADILKMIQEQDKKHLERLKQYIRK